MPITSRFASAAARAYGMFRIAAAAAVDPFFNYVTALLHGDGTNGAQNNTFLDSSTNNFTITRNGNTTQGTFSPFSQTGWSNYFDGTANGYLSTPATTDLDLSADFTVQAWVYPTANGQSSNSEIICRGAASTLNGWHLLFPSGTTQPCFQVNFSGLGNSSTSIQSSVNVPLNYWTHIAVTRSGNTAKIYINGNLDTTNTGFTTAPTTNGSDVVYIGRSSYDTTNRQFTGYVSNASVIKGTALTTFNTTTPLSTSTSGQSLLTCTANRFLDANTATTAKAITAGSGASVQAFSPFNPTSAWSASSNGGSGYFDGSGDYLTGPANSTPLSFGTGDFTIESWVYPTSFTNANSTIFAAYGSTTGAYILYLPSSGYPNFYVYLSGGLNGNVFSNPSSRLALNAWSHVAVTRSSGVFRLFINGVVIDSFTNTTANINATTSNNSSVGAYFQAGMSLETTSPITGYLADVRVVKGTAVYTAAFTPPTSPLTAITNTSFLMSATNAGIYDNAAVGDYETVGNAQVSTSVVKYGTGSMAFDGTGDYLVTNTPSTQPMAFGTGNFTIEFWLYVSALPSAGTYNVIYDSRPSGTNGLYPTITLKGSTLVYYTNTADQITSGSISATTWYHVALCRTASQTKLFINGTQVGATYADTNAYINATSRPLIGDSGSTPGSTNALNGYIDDLRVTKGVSRYQYNFTPPAAAFPNIGGTVTPTSDQYFNYTTLLLPGNGTNGAQNNTFLDSSSNAFTITRNGNTTQGNFSPFSQTGWGNYFNGTSAYLTTPVFGAGNGAGLFTSGATFTVETWLYQSAFVTTSGYVNTIIGDLTPTAATALWWAIGTDSSNAPVLRWYDGVVKTCTGSTALITNSWNHVAFVCNAGAVTIYVNGTAQSLSGTTTITTPTGTTGNLYVGADRGNYVTGYFSNLRVVKNSAVYTSNFTPSTTPLTAITNTQLLTCQSNRFVDNSTNAYAITSTNASVQAFSPFAPTAAWSASTNGGSGYFDGSGDYLSLADNAAFQYGTGDFTIEFWFYMSATAGSGNYYVLYDGRPSGTSGAYVNIAINNATPESYVSGSTVITGSALSANTWYHFAYARSGTSTKMFVNGTQVGSTYTDTTNYVNGTSRPVIGTNGFSVGTSNFNGYLSNYRVVKGTAVYTANFTPPTAPLTAISGTSLLLSATNGGIVDATAKNDLETVGNAQISTTQSKFGGSSMYFDGTGDWLQIPWNQYYTIGSSDYTVEAWIKTSGTTGEIVSAFNSSSPFPGWLFGVGFNNNDGKLKFYNANGSTSETVSSVNTVNNNNWNHVAISKYGTSLRFFINGVLDSTYTLTVVGTGSGQPILIGADNNTVKGRYYTGYIQDLRITKGIARYTSNFTPPTTAFLTL